MHVIACRLPRANQAMQSQMRAAIVFFAHELSHVNYHIVLYTITHLVPIISIIFFYRFICSNDNDAKFVSDKARIEAPPDSSKTLLFDIRF